MGFSVGYGEALAIESVGQAVRAAGFLMPGALVAYLPGGWDRVRGRRWNHGGSGADNACAFEEVAAAGIGGTAALRHSSSPKCIIADRKNRRIFIGWVVAA